jgi:hypothetical protein
VSQRKRNSKLRAIRRHRVDIYNAVFNKFMDGKAPIEAVIDRAEKLKQVSK